MNSTPVATIPKNKLEEIRVSILKNNKVDVRTFFYFPRETEPKPTRKGIWLSFKHLPSIIRALDKAAKAPQTDIQLEFAVSDKEKLRVNTSTYMRLRIFHIRSFHLKKGEFKAGKGLAFNVAIAKHVAAALRKTMESEQAKTAG